VRLELGNPVRCKDGSFGNLADVVIDPTTQRVTHLVVSPTRQDVISERLVPIELVDTEGDGKTILLRSSVEEAGEFETVKEVAYLRMGDFPVSDPDWDVGVQEVLASPFYEGTGYGSYPGELGADAVVYDRVPKGEIEIRRASPVYSADGHHLGHVDGFVVDADGAVTHVVLERGHLWGRREVTIPIGDVAKASSDEVTLGLAKDQVGALPAVHVGRWGGHDES
jgi:sporulation protein YlmC with PRC-barrel domain